ncbi:MAG TPA: anti-sigma factor domain-containing protein [Acetivibrio thermocellus]|uniref:anti-sigma-I factor RsgI family protein n=1 Tax=Acetivibrio thermocellus TaxID=1515 RepID=UPI0010A5AEF2|nr:anti-sigma factor domain-containing protein [Acetivibrio thermocellus]THJ77819.1 anti-sigma factor domain-containing protein [Acetivibrio thermocellus]HOP93303.1 anti-sigma factor domain-containing protein [Acetivibrio thermocellus]
MMTKQKGTILKLKNNLAIIMTSDCKIVSIKRQPGMYEGLEISFNKNEIINKKNKLAFYSRIAAGIAAIFIIMVISFNLFNNNDVYAYVAIDSDASIEFELDKNNKIVKVNYYNDNTNTVLDELDLKNKPVDFAIKEVIKKLDLNESVILISACLKEQNTKKSSASDNYESEKLSKLIDICKNAVEVNVSENVESKVVEVSYDYKKLAEKNKLSLGRSIVYEKAKEQGIALNIEDIKNKSIGETLQKVKIDDVGVVHNVKKEEPKKPMPEKPEPGKPEPQKPEPGKPDPAKPEPGKPGPEKPEPEKPEPAKPEPAKPEPQPQINDLPKDKTIPEEKTIPNPGVEPMAEPIVEPKDKQQEKPRPDSKLKLEEKPTVEPKDSLEEKPVTKPKDDKKEKAKNSIEKMP